MATRRPSPGTQKSRATTEITVQWTTGQPQNLECRPEIVRLIAEWIAADLAAEQDAA